MFIMQWFMARRRILAMAACVLALLFYLVLSGLYEDFLAIPFDSSYKHWGPETPLAPLIQQIRDNATPDVLPVNKFTHSYTILSKHKCQVKEPSETIRLVYVVKSALQNFYKRDIIRQSWGFEQRFSDGSIRTVFLVGTRPDEPHFQVRLNEENKQHKDIVQADFVDAYYNNTIKAMMGLHWTSQNCAKAKYFLFVDDDYYVSTRNLLRFLKDPNNYPQNLETDDVNAVNNYPENLYAGYVFTDNYPHRWTWSKWYISLKEYPYSHYPPYITGGGYVVSQKSLQMLYYACMYTIPLRFDDVFIGLCAMKGNVNPFHHPEFYVYRPPYSIDGFRHVIYSHGFGDPDEMYRKWEEQRSAGNA